MEHTVIDTDTGLPLLDPLRFAEASRDRDILRLVREALADGRARLAFQPILSAADPKRVVFFEGLIRVTDTGGRVIPAAHFMPVVEDTDLGRQIDVVTLELAFKMLRHNPDRRLSINVSARSLADGRWRRMLDAGLQERGTLGNRLIFEITERSAMSLHEVLIQFMEEMQPRGVAFALDGFGAGMTSFQYLRDLFFDMVKIDKGFAVGVADDPDQQVLMETLILVARQFEMYSIADGVETVEDANALRKMGVDCMQGYHFGVPRFHP